MKEFGLYVIKPNYMMQFSSVDNSLQGLKGSVRPFVCVKVTIDRQNWVIPIASLNPDAPDYNKKLAKYSDFYKLDKEQAKKDNRPYARAITFFKDLTGLQSNPDFQSVVEYYNALPVKHKYCKKYRDKSGKHIVITDEKTKTIIKRVFKENIAAKLKGEEVGFIKAKIDAGRTDFLNYSKKSLKIREELYKDHIALQNAEREKRKRVEQQRADTARKKELSDTVKGVALEQQIEIEPQRIVGTTENGDIIIKISGKNPEDVKTQVTLPKESIVLDKDRTHVIGISLEQQKKFNFKLPGGQLRRILK